MTRRLCACWLKTLRLLLIFALLIFAASAFTVERRRLPGIWKLTCDSLPYEVDIRSKLKGIFGNDAATTEEEVWIKLNPDGSFKQCNEGYSEGRWLAGRWEVNDQKQLVLALRRQYYGPQFDVLLEGEIGEDANLKVKGAVQKGKFMYPQKHPSFFEAPLVNQEALGTFTLEQSIATFSVAPVRVQNPDEENRFERADFYDRHFIMTIEPVEAKKKGASSSSSNNGQGEQPLNLPIDIRAMPVQFFGNNTFQANGINKIMRGRFDIADNGELAFEVSLFGNGRSVSGSVYSEGLGLNHEDERSYIGSIEEREGRFRVQGMVTFGADMGSDARPEPVGTFILTETVPEDEETFFFDMADEDYGIFE
jgi:hypothetical protein